MPLTPEDVQNKRFTVTRFRPGYDEEEVDSFLDEIVAELQRLNALAGAGGPAAAAAPIPAAAPAPPPVAEAAPPPAVAAPPRPEEGQEAALRTLLLAQKTADEAVAQAKAEAEQILSEARQRAGDLERQAQEQHTARVSALSRERQQLEAQVEGLRGFEREFRSRLRGYLESQLRDLQSAPPLAPPAPPGVASQTGGPVAGGPGGASPGGAGPAGGPGAGGPRGGGVPAGGGSPGLAPAGGSATPGLAPSGPGGAAHHGPPVGGPGAVPARGGRLGGPTLEEDLAPGADVAEGPPREASSDIDERDHYGREG